MTKIQSLMFLDLWQVRWIQNLLVNYWHVYHHSWILIGIHWKFYIYVFIPSFLTTWNEHYIAAHCGGQAAPRWIWFCKLYVTFYVLFTFCEWFIIDGNTFINCKTFAVFLQLRKAYQRQKQRNERLQDQVTKVFNSDQLQALQRYLKAVCPVLRTFKDSLLEMKICSQHFDKKNYRILYFCKVF